MTNRKAPETRPAFRHEIFPEGTAPRDRGVRDYPAPVAIANALKEFSVNPLSAGKVELRFRSEEKHDYRGVIVKKLSSGQFSVLGQVIREMSGKDKGSAVHLDRIDEVQTLMEKVDKHIRTNYTFNPNSKPTFGMTYVVNWFTKTDALSEMKQKYSKFMPEEAEDVSDDQADDMVYEGSPVVPEVDEGAPVAPEVAETEAFTIPDVLRRN